MYLDEGPHTVRRLAALFGICKSAVTRALDRLGGLGLARRQVDPRDRCSVLVHRTEFGWAFLVLLCQMSEKGCRINMLARVCRTRLSY